MSKLRSVLITGANRGIGLQLVKAVNAKFNPEFLFATYRDSAKSEELHKLASENKSIHLLQLDVKDHERFDEVASTIRGKVGEQGLNLLLNNAGISSKFARIGATRPQELIQNFEINTVAPIMMTKAMLPLLESASAINQNDPAGIAKAAVVNFSSILGSIKANEQGGMYSYRCSKAAVNAASKSMHYDLKKSDIIVIALHPGWVRTDMGGPKADLSTEESVNGITTLLGSLSASHSGKFWQYDGKELQW